MIVSNATLIDMFTIVIDESNGHEWCHLSDAPNCSITLLLINITYCHHIFKVKAIGHFKSEINLDFLKGLSELKIKMVEANISKSF
jgi:hypothetical protein